MRRMRRGPGLVGAAATTAVVVGTAGRVSRRQQQKAAQQQAAQQQAAAPEQGMEQAAGGDVGDEAAQIQQLAQLKEQGLLTEEEFAAKKKQILGI